ncbi:hypothetical protein [Phyllobacterium myrsinacearum]|uniref:Pilus assembly protein n=1 Tax=Phyllobacterium myrsinacearum TaxID=28101 RepID=A0A839EQ72_9HYPH|nr:hypothetical protein [Phyllobacterium myrsinacearum]MBA8879566.1 hypothetical protein [Phyllobacterium myrsinacearum]
MTVHPRKALYSVVLFAVLGISGCMTQPEPYSPNYHYVSTGTAAANGNGKVVRKGYDRPGDIAEGRILVPDACTTPDNTADALYLPQGCANNLNLQLMAEKESDLLRGREMGPAMAAPVARAAKRVIEGDDRTGSKPTESTTNLGGI